MHDKPMAKRRVESREPSRTRGCAVSDGFEAVEDCRIAEGIADRQAGTQMGHQFAKMQQPAIGVVQLPGNTGGPKAMTIGLLTMTPALWPAWRHRAITCAERTGSEPGCAAGHVTFPLEVPADGNPHDGNMAAIGPLNVLGTYLIRRPDNP